MKSCGATHVIDRKLPSDRIVEEVKAISGGPVDLTFDAVSELDTLRELAVPVLRQGGQLVYVFPAHEEVVKKLASEKGIEAVCSRAFQSSEQTRGALAGLYAKLPELLQQGLIKVGLIANSPISSFPLC